MTEKQELIKATQKYIKERRAQIRLQVHLKEKAQEYLSKLEKK